MRFPENIVLKRFVGQFLIGNLAKILIFEVYCILADLIFVHFHEILRTNPLKILVNSVSAYIFEV